MTVIGVLGAGQLGRMLALAGYPLGMRFRFFDPAADSPAGHLAPHVAAAYDDWEALRRFAEGVDAFTYEFENVPVETVQFLAQFAPVYPPPVALEKGQDRLVEKTFFRSLGIPTPDFSGNVSEWGSGFPVVVKTCRMGYDGKGQFVVRDEASLLAALEALHGQDVILEQFVPFEREVSIIGVRGQDGEMVFYPLTANVHRDGILRTSVVGGEPNPLQGLAEDYARRVMAALGYVGVLAIEFFEKDGQLLANEMAPRVHNSGHWTIDGAVTSQFENHVRAVAGLPLGSTRPLGAAGMVNLIGAIPDVDSVLAIEGAHLHLYGKSPRPGRKVGHVNLLAVTGDELWHKMEKVVACLDG
ncbi:MAG: 5-(carboxyamino)imidazole ribonucleotide synthase [Anaerolineales bacterium]